MNYYVVLGIAEDADGDTIRSAFRAMARRYHPDAGAGASSEAFRRVVEAYETLNDPHRRRVYDRGLQRHPVPSRRTGRRFVEPLSNRNPADPAGFTRSSRHADSAHIQIDLDEILDALVSGFDLAFWSVHRRGRF